VAAAGSQNPVYAAGRWAFRFALVYSLVSTFLATVLAASGVPVPDLLLAIPFKPGGIAGEIEKAAQAGPQLTAITGAGLALLAVFNFFAGIALGLPSLMYRLAAAVDPVLAAAAALFGSFLQISIYWYLFQSVIGAAGGGG